MNGALVQPLPETTERVATEIVDSCYKVYTALGPGLLESAYVVCLQHELNRRGLSVRREVAVPVVYDGVRLDAGYRVDLLVADAVIVEAKAVEKMNPLFDAQLLTYLRLLHLQLGILVNFNCRYLKDNIRRVISTQSS
jgi:GxxExxY protein